jgi:hypothetical protein
MSRFDDNDARAVQDAVGRYGSCISRPQVSCPEKAVGRIDRVALSNDDARALRRFERLLVVLVVLVGGGAHVCKSVGPVAGDDVND